MIDVPVRTFKNSGKLLDKSLKESAFIDPELADQSKIRKAVKQLYNYISSHKCLTRVRYVPLIHIRYISA